MEERISARDEMRRDERGQADSLARERPPSTRTSSFNLRSSRDLPDQEGVAAHSARASLKDKLAHFHKISASPRSPRSKFKQSPPSKSAVARRSPFNLASLAEKHDHVAEAHPSWRDAHPSWRGPPPSGAYHSCLQPLEESPRAAPPGTAASIQPMPTERPEALRISLKHAAPRTPPREAEAEKPEALRISLHSGASASGADGTAQSIAIRAPAAVDDVERPDIEAPAPSANPEAAPLLGGAAEMERSDGDAPRLRPVHGG